MVALAVIGLLGAILAPAIMATRESARRTQCLNNLRQMGVALQSHESAYRRYPRGGDMYGDGSNGQKPRSHAPHLYLLPFLDEANAFQMIDRRLQAERWLLISPGHNDANEVMKQQRFPVFVCPTDGMSDTFLNSYRACIGATAFPRGANKVTLDPRQAGAFAPVNRSLSSRDCQDGLSNTAAFSERLMGDDDDLKYTPRRDWFYISGMGQFDNIWNSPAPDAAIGQACESLRNQSPPHDSTSGAFWFYGGLADTWYSHFQTPNHPVPDCGAVKGMAGGGVISARSDHDGGVNLAFLDGSVRFYSDAIDHRVWKSIGTRSGEAWILLD